MEMNEYLFRRGLDPGPTSTCGIYDYQFFRKVLLDHQSHIAGGFKGSQTHYHS